MTHEDAVSWYILVVCPKYKETNSLTYKSQIKFLLTHWPKQFNVTNSWSDSIYPVMYEIYK